MFEKKNRVYVIESKYISQATSDYEALANIVLPLPNRNLFGDVNQATIWVSEFQNLTITIMRGKIFVEGKIETDTGFEKIEKTKLSNIVCENGGGIEEFREVLRMLYTTRFVKPAFKANRE